MGMHTLMSSQLMMMRMKPILSSLVSRYSSTWSCIVVCAVHLGSNRGPKSVLLCCASRSLLWPKSVLIYLLSCPDCAPLLPVHPEVLCPAVFAVQAASLATHLDSGVQGGPLFQSRRHSQPHHVRLILGVCEQCRQTHSEGECGWRSALKEFLLV